MNSGCSATAVRLQRHLFIFAGAAASTQHGDLHARCIFRDSAHSEQIKSINQCINHIRAHRQDVSILDVRGRVDTVELEPGVEKSSYIAEYDEGYLAGHIPVSACDCDYWISTFSNSGRHLPCMHAWAWHNTVLPVHAQHTDPACRSFQAESISQPRCSFPLTFLAACELLPPGAG